MGYRDNIEKLLIKLNLTLTVYFFKIVFLEQEKFRTTECTRFGPKLFLIGMEKIYFFDFLSIRLDLSITDKKSCT